MAYTYPLIIGTEVTIFDDLNLCGYRTITIVAGPDVLGRYAGKYIYDTFGLSDNDPVPFELVMFNENQIIDDDYEKAHTITFHRAPQFDKFGDEIDLEDWVNLPKDEKFMVTSCSCGWEKVLGVNDYVGAVPDAASEHSDSSWRQWRLDHPSDRSSVIFFGEGF